MFKLLLLLLAVWLIIAIVKRQRNQPRPRPPEVKSANMVRCAVCDIHIPDSEAISSKGLYYCCEAHFLQRSRE